MLEVLDAILNLVEPGGVLDASHRRTSLADVVVDHRGAEPAETWEGNTLYGSVAIDGHGAPDFADREDFVVELVRVFDASDEEKEQERLRSISEAIDDAAHDYISILDANRAGGDGRPWTYLTSITIDWERMRRINERGFAARVTGWRHREPA